MSDRGSSNEKGQSIILVAVAIVALVMFVAITVDVSFAYQQRRTAQNGADGAALAGVAEMATQINNRKKLDGLIQKAMHDFAERNGIQDTDTTLANDTNDNVEGWYVDAEGNRLTGEPMVGDGTVPDATYGIEAITHITAPTFFGGIFGLSGLPLTARAVSLLREVCGSDCVVPITTDMTVLCGQGSKPGECKDEEKNKDQCFNIWRENQTEVPTPGLYGWISWSWQQAMCEEPTGDGRPCPNVDQGVNACDSGTLAQNLDPTACASGFIQVGDWASGTSGVVNADDVRCWLGYYEGSYDENCNLRPVAEHEPHPFTIPIYITTTMDLAVPSDTPCLRMKDPTDPSSGGLHYNVAGFAKMQLLGFQLSQGEGVVSVGHNGEGCATKGTVPHNGNRITAEFIDYVTDYATSSACYDPLGTLRASPKLSE